MNQQANPEESAAQKANRLLNRTANPSALGERKVHWSRSSAAQQQQPLPQTAQKPIHPLLALQKSHSIALQRVNSQPLHFDRKPIKDLEVAKTIIDETVTFAFDENISSIDLSNAGLTVLPSAICQLKFLTPVNNQRAFCKLQIFLNNNFIERIPDELYQIPKVGILSLRSNQIEEISPLVWRMQELEELSLSGNRLNFLPGDLAFLPSLKTVSFQQNPFIGDDEIERVNALPLRQVTLREMCIRLLAVHSPLFCKSMEIALYHCTQCHKLIHAPYSKRFQKIGLASTAPVPFLFLSCDAKCHEKLSEEIKAKFD